MLILFNILRHRIVLIVNRSTHTVGKGTEPEWNENFVFTISDGVSELTIKIMDSDSGSDDDLVGEAT